MILTTSIYALTLSQHCFDVLHLQVYGQSHQHISNNEGHSLCAVPEQQHTLFTHC